MLTKTLENISLAFTRLKSPFNHDIHEQRLTSSTIDPKYNITPWSINFLYMAFDINNRPDIRHYFHAYSSYIEYMDVPNYVRDLVLKARNHENDDEIKHRSLHGLRFFHKSYIAILVDSPYWNFATIDGQSAVIFNTEKGSAPNHSFFDANVHPIENLPLLNDEDTGSRSVLYFVNHMKKSEFGDDLGIGQNGYSVPGGEKEPFVFDIYFDVPGGGDQNSSIFIIDPDGTNEGPPIGPP